MTFKVGDKIIEKDHLFKHKIQYEIVESVPPFIRLKPGNELDREHHYRLATPLDSLCNRLEEELDEI